MKRKWLTWQVYLPLLTAVILVMACAAAYSVVTVKAFHYTETQTVLESLARIAAEHLRQRSNNLGPATVDAICKKLGQASGARLTVIRTDGRILGDARADPATMDDHSTRPEIREALAGRTGASIRFSRTMQQRMMYVAVPLNPREYPGTVVRCAFSVDEVDRLLGALRRKLVAFVLVVALLGGSASVLLARRIGRPLVAMRRAAQAFADGHLEGRVLRSGVAEIDELADSLNRMAEQLNDRIRTITLQRDEQVGLFSCMVEAVLAVDNQQHLIRLNRSAADLFNVDPAASRGKSVLEVIRNADLHAVVEQALASDELVEGTVFLPDGDRWLRAHGTVLRGGSEEKLGALLVLNDITQLRLLETMRSDFVANVSHELKTPVTSIKGFAETLLTGAAEDAADRARFLEIIARQADRLQSIIEDLLTLSAIEHEANGRRIEMQHARVMPVLEGAVRSCREAAEARGLQLGLKTSGGPVANINRELLEQAVINLIDNAVKYSDEGAKVDVVAEEADEYVVLRVHDTGPGIPRKHLDRIFERFYRVDKARSRKLGGTGLGLAIVKQVARAHGGHVEVESTLGEGSTFSVYLPRILPLSGS